MVESEVGAVVDRIVVAVVVDVDAVDSVVESVVGALVESVELVVDVVDSVVESVVVGFVVGTLVVPVVVSSVVLTVLKLLVVVTVPGTLTHGPLLGTHTSCEATSKPGKIVFGEGGEHTPGGKSIPSSVFRLPSGPVKFSGRRAMGKHAPAQS